ncbi:hypothetical protein L249_4826 [Ophiocordyceps polyrhachis-furcata BCC 54312]|uniref:Telomeric single stranded DNA binding POT1/Cdc13 domain-containing protein n=1 Tax=Ophiocordyceps polyrhachis-furcata BCC 54312 TaxID=1330021 RepID=A0A367L3C7_9HYPO|nr:hypothetical protein L249_4826 [Ophiocordyceps polyrhachis-furcata BCC 54312]
MGGDDLEALRSAEATPLAQLQPEIDGAASRVVDGVVTITWPYSSVTRSTAFILADRDYHLRSCGGQIRVEFRTAAAKALADAAVGGGDEVRVSLQGARWNKVEPQIRLPRGSSDWQLLFESRLLLSVQRAQDQSCDVIDIDVPPQPDGSSSESLPPQDVSIVSPTHAQTALPPVSDPVAPSALPAKRQAPPEFETDEFASPAFIKRARMSYGALLEDGLGLDMFLDGDKEKKRSKNKRSSFFSRHATSWKYNSRSPSPATDATSGRDTDGGETSMDTGGKEAEKPSKTSPPRPTMVDGASQTQEAYFSPPVTGVHTSANTSVLATRIVHPQNNNDDFYTPSRTLFERPSGQHVTSRTTEGTTMAFEPQPLGLATEAHTVSPSASDPTMSAVAFTRGTPHYPVAALGTNHISTPAMNIDPSLQYSNDVHADEHLYYATRDFPWQADVPVEETSLASVRAGIRESDLVMAASSSGRSRRLVSPGLGSDSTSRLSLSRVEREQAQETEMMARVDHYHAYPPVARATGQGYDLGTQVAVDDGDPSRSPHSLDELEQENAVAAEEVVDPFTRYENNRSRTGSYSSDGRSDTRTGANYDMQRRHQDGYEAEFEHSYQARYSADESDEGSGSAPATPREPVVIDLLSDSDSDAGGPETTASQAVDVPDRRRQYETDSTEANDDGVSDASVEDVASYRSEADVDEDQASARSVERSEENDAFMRSNMDAGEGEVSDDEVERVEVAASSAKSQASVTSDEDVGESNATPRRAGILVRSSPVDAESPVSVRSEAASEVSAQSQASARFEADDGRNEASAGSANSQASSTSEANAAKADDLNQDTEQGEASGGRAHDQGAEVASSEHERASEERSVMASHANEEMRPVGDAADSSSPEPMDVDVEEAPGHSKSDLEEQAKDDGEEEENEEEKENDEDDEPVEAIAEESDMDAEAMASQPAGQDVEDAASQPDARAQESDMDAESLASQPPRPEDMDGARPSSQLAERDATTEHVGMDPKVRTSESEVAVIIPQHLGQDIGGDEQSQAKADKEEGLSEGQACGQTAGSKSDEEFEDAPTSPQHHQEEKHDAEAGDENAPREEPTQVGIQELSSSQNEEQPEQRAEETAKAETPTTTELHDGSQAVGEDEEPDASQTNTRSLRDKTRTKSKGQELEVLIPAKSLRHSLRASSATNQELRDDDPSVALATSPQSSGFGMGKETRSTVRLRAARSNHKGDETDPSLRLARASVSEAGKAKDGSSTTRKADGPANRSKRRQTTPETTTATTRELRSSGRASSPVESTRASPSTTVTGGDEETAEAKRKLLATLRTRLPEAVSLWSLRSLLNRTVDVVAMSTMTPAQPHRPKHGPRDYMLELVLTDASTAPGRVVVAQLFRPHVESLPVVQAGDVVLLRRVQVMSLQGRGFGVRAGEASAWAVFEKDEKEMLAQIKGPPVEVTEGEVEYARGLKQWWALVMRNEQATARVEKATGKVAMKAKDRA